MFGNQYKPGSPYKFRTTYSPNGWYCEIYSQDGQTLATTSVHRHAENAEIEADHIIDHLVAYGELA